MKVSEAKLITGGLSTPSKMPGKCYGLPATRCKLGAILRAQGKKTVCGNCYALKGQYAMFPTVFPAQERRYQAITTDPRWIEAMTLLISKETYFRWHDSGDLQDVNHLEKIVIVAQQTPKTKHWLPTREMGIVKSYIQAGGILPKNLTIRISATLIDGPAPKINLPVSRVSANGKGTCPAPKQEGKCLDCRKCWDRKVKNVTYSKH